MSQYGFDDNTVSEKRTGGFIEPGIRENLEISKLELTAGEGDNNPFLFVEATDPEGRTVHKRFYEPTIGGFITSQEILQREVKKFNGVIANISRKFLGHNYKATGNNFTEVVSKVITDIGANFSGIKLRGKIVLNQKDFPTFPGYAPIFERMDEVTIEKTELKLGINDKVIREENQQKQNPNVPAQSGSNIAAPWTQPGIPQNQGR